MTIHAVLHYQDYIIEVIVDGRLPEIHTCYISPSLDILLLGYEASEAFISPGRYLQAYYWSLDDVYELKWSRQLRDRNIDSYAQLEMCPLRRSLVCIFKLPPHAPMRYALISLCFVLFCSLYHFVIYPYDPLMKQNLHFDYIFVIGCTGICQMTTSSATSD